MCTITKPNLFQLVQNPIHTVLKQGSFYFKGHHKSSTHSYNFATSWFSLQKKKKYQHTYKLVSAENSGDCTAMTLRVCLRTCIWPYMECACIPALGLNKGDKTDLALIYWHHSIVSFKWEDEVNGGCGLSQRWKLANRQVHRSQTSDEQGSFNKQHQLLMGSTQSQISLSNTDDRLHTAVNYH